MALLELSAVGRLAAVPVAGAGGVVLPEAGGVGAVGLAPPHVLALRVHQRAVAVVAVAGRGPRFGRGDRA